jgi:tryptophan synthase alpha chain
VGVCGFIVPDMPLEEAGNFEVALRANGVALVRMVTPVTPPARLKHLCDGAEGFIYAVTMTGTTGKNVTGADDALTSVGTYLDAVREQASIPVCAGFGIRGPAQVKALDPHCDGVIVGSALVETLERGESVAALLDGLRGGTA